MRRTTVTCSLLFAALSLVIFSQVRAQDATPAVPSDNQVNAIASQMYCPVCENIPLDVCPTQACIEWRELIREKLALGWSEEQIKDYFVEQFGDRVLATPPATGFNWLVYVIPPIAFVVGAFILYRAFRSLMRVEPQSDRGIVSAPSGSRDEYYDRLEEELRNR